jgi:cytosine/uracil/thiamine/allantoin permease
MAELLAHRGRYDAGALHLRSGPYWYGNGIRWGGVYALALGMACAALLQTPRILRAPFPRTFSTAVTSAQSVAW